MRRLHYCTSLKSVNLEETSITYLGLSAFGSCRGLTSIALPDTLKTIGDQAFYFCSGITTLDLGNGVESIGTSAFAYCSGFETLVIPASVKTIGSGAFVSCSKLTSLTFEETSGWKAGEIELTAEDLEDEATAIILLTKYTYHTPAGYGNYVWTREE